MVRFDRFMDSIVMFRMSLILFRVVESEGVSVMMDELHWLFGYGADRYCICPYLG